MVKATGKIKNKEYALEKFDKLIEVLISYEKTDSECKRTFCNVLLEGLIKLKIEVGQKEQTKRLVSKAI